MKSIALFIFPLVFQILFQGCTTTTIVLLDYEPTSNLPSNLGNKTKIGLNVFDKRDTEIFGRGGLQISSQPELIIRDGLSDALTATNFILSSSSDKILTAEIIKFDVSWPSGADVPVTAEIVLDIILLNSGGEPLSKRRISEQVTEYSPGGGWPALPIAERVIKRCLDQVINDSIQIPAILSAIHGGSIDGKGNGSSGTGFAVSSDGFIMTAYHLIENASSIIINMDNEKVECSIATTDRSNDLALLKVEEPTPDFLTVISSTSLNIGDKVFTIGFPVPSLLGQNSKYSEGVVSSLTGISGISSLLQVSVPIQPGNSGGPVLNKDGMVVGIITSSAAIENFYNLTGTMPQNVNWAIKSDYAKVLLNFESVDTKSLNVETNIQELQKAVFLIEVK